MSLFCVIAAVNASDYMDSKYQELNSKMWDEQKIREHVGSLIFLGEPFLTKSKTFTDFFYDMCGLFSFHAWDGFLAGLYQEPIMEETSYILNQDGDEVGTAKYMSQNTCLGNRSLKYLKKTVLLTETTTKDDFFIHIA